MHFLFKYFIYDTFKKIQTSGINSEVEILAEE